MKNPPNIHTGDTVIITADGRTLEAVVKLASSNSVSLMLSFEAILHGHAGMMPLLWDDGQYISLVGNHVVDVRQP